MKTSDYVTKQGETVDLACWKHYGFTKEITEQVLYINHGLAELGPVLPVGTVIKMPVVERSNKQPRLVKLWD